MLRYPTIVIERKDNGWVYTLRLSASTETQGVHADGAPLVLKFYTRRAGSGDFTLTLEADNK